MATDKSPKKLFRYRPLSNNEQFVRETESLTNSYLWFSKFSELNDPSELDDAYINSIGFVLGSAIANQSNFARQMVKHAIAKARVEAHLLMPKQNSSVCCFSESNSHQAMWAYYADNFRGICIEYNVKKLLALTEFCWGNSIHQVRYKKESKLLLGEILPDTETMKVSQSNQSIGHMKKNGERFSVKVMERPFIFKIPFLASH